jgi:NADH dehydrogenase/NADH:ubiquinone oxidoreductase subunit G
MKIQIIVDGRLVQVDEGTSILNAARKAGIVIPTLCYHEALKPYGGCRLCIVEVVQNKRRKLITSCTFPAGVGMKVLTDTARVKHARRMVVELLLARCPDVPEIRSMAKHMGIETPMFNKTEKKRCILCGLCVRFCEEAVGAKAIGFSNRGTECEITTPFKAPTETCIGCGSCTYICPTGCIEMVQDKEHSEKHTMNMDRPAIHPCRNEYKCETCETEQQFIEEAKNAIADFRNKFSGPSVFINEG